jgi:lysozyme
MTETAKKNPTIEQLKRHEGFRQRVYKCTAGYDTVGFGYNLSANPLALTPYEIKQFYQTGINVNIAAFLLLRHVEQIENALTKQFAWFEGLNEARRGVLINMAFNLGLVGLFGFKNTLRMIQAGDFEGAANGMLQSKWAKQVKGRAIELSNQMKNGTYA